MVFQSYYLFFLFLCNTAVIINNYINSIISWNFVPSRYAIIRSINANEMRLLHSIVHIIGKIWIHLND